ncbi:zn2cys6 transcription regulator [Fusarium sporotrichioides]|uniref:Zn2cys6 transcription regulator n=1 Tax=Fusarium sporotrichioides TaxID=5514 RepID=A0A395SDA3_FUSSP|nr:zn2cys6 transcription regulator [Fusarium sporotrichioides]
MSRRCYVETSPDGRPQLVTIKRSRSYHHTHRHQCDYYKVSREEWKTLIRQNELLDEANQAYAAQNETLRSRLHASEAETHRLCHVVIPSLNDQVAKLSRENECLRRAAEKPCDPPVHILPISTHHHSELERLREKVCKLDKENKTLRDDNGDLRFRLRELSKQVDQSLSRRVADLTKQIEYWTNQSGFWKKKYDDLRERHLGLITIVESKTEKTEYYDDVLKRRRVC